MIDLVPLKQFSGRIAKGWRMVPGFPLEPGDYAVTMQSPDHEWMDQRSNKSRGATSRNRVCKLKRDASRIPSANPCQDVA